MINLKVTTNLDDVVDYINSIPNQIEMIISQVMADSMSELQTSVPDRFGNAASEATVMLDYNGGEIVITVDGVNPYHLYNSTGESYEDILAYVEDFVSNKMTEKFRSEGFDYGN